MRLLAGMLAAQAFDSTMVGDASLSRRPMRRVIEPLTLMGARIDSSEGHAPLVIHGSRLHGVAYRPAVPSAQVKSAVLLAGLHADGATSVTEPAATRDHTERALRAFGLPVAIEGPTIRVAGGGRGHGQTLPVPGDFSSAAFWMVAAAALPGSRIEIEDVGLNPTRTALAGVLRRFGAVVDLHELDAAGGEPRGTVVVEAGRTGRVDVAPDEVPALIDELPAIAALAAHGGEVHVSGAAELRVKESDRIAALVAGFRGLGLNADERPDGFVVCGSGPPAGGVADAQGDHRMAMAFAIAALAAQGASRIEGADAVGISYPQFFETLDRLVA
jgi:3-phosphoshikimate 1-carboxyvinyltransferase